MTSVQETLRRRRIFPHLRHQQQHKHPDEVSVDFVVEDHHHQDRSTTTLLSASSSATTKSLKTTATTLSSATDTIPDMKTLESSSAWDTVSVDSSHGSHSWWNSWGIPSWYYGSGTRYFGWDSPYDCPPKLHHHVIWMLGIFVFVLALLWPPLILLWTYLASKLIPYTVRENDDAARRRELYSQFVNPEINAHYEELPEKFRNIHQYVDLEESYWTNERGMALKTMIMKPKTSKKKKKHKQSSASSQPIRAVVCFCHGYTDNVSFAKRIEFQRLCQAGIAFVALEYEGHGRSDGTLGLIHDWELLIDDATSYFSYVTQHNKAFRNVPVFLMGESMGGAVAYCVYNRAPQLFQGVVFVCPMCKISDDMLPPQYVIDFLTWLIGPTGTTSLLGYLPIAPSKQDLSDVTYRVQEKGLMNSRSPLIYDRNPRLATARELIAVTQRISASLHEFRAPFLVLHGKADRVTDPMLSQALYNESPSNDKSIRLYDGMWHALTCGEPNENIDRVFNDIITWILQRAGESENS